MWPAASASTPTSAETSVIGADGSAKTPPDDRVPLTTKNVVPVGEGEYARGSSSCANAGAVLHSRENRHARTLAGLRPVVMTCRHGRAAQRILRVTVTSLIGLSA